MSMSKFFLGAAAVLAMAGTAFGGAKTYRSAVNGGSWSNAASWEYDVGGGVWHNAATDSVAPPGSGDTVTIRSSYPILVDAANANFLALTVDAGAALTVDSSYVLTVDVSGSATINGSLTVAGVFTGPSSGSVTINNTAAVSVSGTFNANGTTTDNDGMILTSTGTLIVYGTYYANNSIQITSGGLVDVSGGVLSVSNASISIPAASLKLEGSAPVLTLNLADAISLPNAASAVWVATSASINGSGSLSGANAAASIKIGPASGSSTVQLSNYVVIRGALTIKKFDVSYGTAVFANIDGATDGFVIADGNYAGTQLQMDSTLDTITARTNDTSGSGANSQWQSINGGRLVFDKVPSAGRYFYVGGSSTLRVNVQFSSSGLNTGYGTLDGSEATYFLANTTLY